MDNFLLGRLAERTGAGLQKAGTVDRNYYDSNKRARYFWAAGPGRGARARALRFAFEI